MVLNYDHQRSNERHCLSVCRPSSGHQKSGREMKEPQQKVWKKKIPSNTELLEGIRTKNIRNSMSSIYWIVQVADSILNGESLHSKTSADDASPPCSLTEATVHIIMASSLRLKTSAATSPELHQIRSKPAIRRPFSFVLPDDETIKWEKKANEETGTDFLSAAVRRPGSPKVNYRLVLLHCFFISS